MTAKVVCVANQKGGVSKTTTSAALLCGLKPRGYRVLGIDLDGQCNLSGYARYDKDIVSIKEVLLGHCGIEDAVQHCELFDVVSSDFDIDIIESALMNSLDKFNRLGNELEKVKERYDFIILDTPPGRGLLELNALCAADTVLIPTTASQLAYKGVNDLLIDIDKVKSLTPKDPSIAGILVTMFRSGTVVEREFYEHYRQFTEKCGIKVFDQTIRLATVVREAEASHASVYDYDPEASVVADFNGFIDEFLEGCVE